MLQHPDVYAPWSKWSEEQRIHVATAYSNPLRWRTRRQLMNDFRRHMQASPNVVLHIGELAYGDRPFEVTVASSERPAASGEAEHHSLLSARCSPDVQLRTSHELWHKENILNLVIQRFPPDWKYGAIIDADFHMTRHDWALEAIHQLQHYDFVQLFSTYTDLDRDQRPYRMNQSACSQYLRSSESQTGKASRGDSADHNYRNFLFRQASEGPPYSVPAGKRSEIVGATGGAWAFRRSAFDAVGGLLDICILGSADWHMAFALLGAVNPAAELKRAGKAYAEAILHWQERAAVLRGNVGCLENHAVHFWHGSRSHRGYGDRWKILRDHKFDPRTDIFRDWQGVWQLTCSNPKLRDDIRTYFRSRREDG